MYFFVGMFRRHLGFTWFHLSDSALVLVFGGSLAFPTDGFIHQYGRSVISFKCLTTEIVCVKLLHIVSVTSKSHQDISRKAV